MVYRCTHYYTSKLFDREQGKRIGILVKWQAMLYGCREAQEKTTKERTEQINYKGKEKGGSRFKGEDRDRKALPHF